MRARGISFQKILEDTTVVDKLEGEGWVGQPQPQEMTQGVVEFRSDRLQKFSLDRNIEEQVLNLNLCPHRQTHFADLLKLASFANRPGPGKGVSDPGLQNELGNRRNAGRASPLKPSVRRAKRSCAVLILLVAYR